MSRSKKKHPIHKDHSLGGKQLANKAVRRFIKTMISIPTGKWYKKVYNSYNLTDWIYRADNEEWRIKFRRK